MLQRVIILLKQNTAVLSSRPCTPNIFQVTFLKTPTGSVTRRLLGNFSLRDRIIRVSLSNISYYHDGVSTHDEYGNAGSVN